LGIVIGAVLLAALVGWIDGVTGLEVSIALFYMLPVALVAWYVGWRMGIAVSIQCAVEGFLAGMEGFSTYSNAAIPYWNAFMMLGFYVALTLSLVALKRSLEHEATLAREIQESLLPRDLSLSPQIAIATAWIPSADVGGDYFDVFPLGSEKIGLCVADVAGHGIPAALLMSNLQAAARVIVNDSVTTAALCAQLNERAVQRFPAGIFVTFFYGVLDLPTYQLAYCNAGHNPPYLIKGDGSVRLLKGGGVALGVIHPWNYQEQGVRLEPGDRLVLFTDGLTEARSPTGELFGEERLVELLIRHRLLSPEAIKDAVLGAVSSFARRVFQDDVTLLCIAVGENSETAP
jgi:serine phosphatase RsbU (regulator of sigma subunit)